jgi:diguanylate cyclase (GGDEF)-like protein
MAEQDGTRMDRSARVWSLRREWSRAFSVMLVILLVTAVAAVVGVTGVVKRVDGTAHQLRHESAEIAALQSVLVAHEELGHKLFSGEPVDRAAFVQGQNAISLEFIQDEKLFPAADRMRAIVTEAQRSWQQGLTAYGLWGTQVASLRGLHLAENPTFGAASDATDALVDSLAGPSLIALDQGLAQDADLERLLIALLAGLFGMALAVTVYFRRRMTRDLFRPVASMHQGVLRLQSGDFEHPIEVTRGDELGELTEAFNGMAGALRDSHLALTMRATRDTLTGLPNRAALTDRLGASFYPGADRRAGQESVLFVDVDDFKVVNDSLGHEGGDTLLIQLAGRLRDCVRPGDLVARLGGDEFAIVVVEEDGDGTTGSDVAERILAALRAPFVVGDVQLLVSVSIGVAQRRAETGDAAELLRHADFAMYMAKGGGKGNFQVFDSQQHDSIVSRSALKNDLAVAADSGQLRLDYQPVADLRTGELLGVEALVRWQHPTRGLLAPAEFIALAEETGDIDAIGRWVLNTATQQASSWRRSFPHCSQLWMAVNLSAVQLGSPQSLMAIQAILADPAAEADHVVLEVTETALTNDIKGAGESLTLLKRLGVRIAVDDFGTGFSSLSALAQLPVDILKIDRSFVSGTNLGPASVPMLEGIMGLADKLKLSVIAEGIEDRQQLDLLRNLGCSTGQGYLLGRPTTPLETEALFASGAQLHLAPAATS